MGTEKDHSLNAIEWHSKVARQFDQRYEISPAFIERRNVWKDIIARYATRSTRTLDAGCGSGVLSFLAAERCRNVVGIDGSPEMIAICEEKKSRMETSNIDFFIMPFESLSNLGAMTFDLILCSSVLEYLSDFWRSIDLLAGRLAPGGVLVFSIPNQSSIYRKFEKITFALTGRPRYYAHVRGLIPIRLVSCGLTKRRLKVLETRYFAPSPISFLARSFSMPWVADNLVLFACRLERKSLH